MKRELKAGADYPCQTRLQSRIARPIPMKRELKVSVSSRLLRSESEIARPIPMKRELKALDCLIVDPFA